MTIGEIAEKTSLSESTLRYYEKKGLIKVARNSSGRRDYEESDIEWIKFIQRLKETGMLLKDIRQYSELRYQGKSTMPERLEILQEHREYVLEQQTKWKEYLQNLDDKIVFYQQSIEVEKLDV
ncbi:MAG: MerR family transcriptional regulator [Lachnospiraceae bacterium]|nr:MerR family transcriptional regulator [Lachnospiraceae bacterium]